jgi:hypothetical protein
MRFSGEVKRTGLGFPANAHRGTSRIGRGRRWRQTEDANPPAARGNDRQHVPKWQTSGGLPGRRSSFISGPVPFRYPVAGRAHSSSGLGRRPLTAVARVRIPYAPPLLPPRNPRPNERGVRNAWSRLMTTTTPVMNRFALQRTPVGRPPRGRTFERAIESYIESEDDLVGFLVAPMGEPTPLAHDSETALRQHTDRCDVVARSVSVERTGCLQLQELS